MRRKLLFYLALYCLGGGLLYSELPEELRFWSNELDHSGIKVYWPFDPREVAGGIIGAAFLWGLSQYARVLGKRLVLLVLLIANPFSWEMPILLFVGAAAFEPDAMNFGLAIGSLALFFVFSYVGWIVLTMMLLGSPVAAALFGGLSGWVFAPIAGITGSWFAAGLPLELSELFDLSDTAFLILNVMLGIALPLWLFWLGWPRKSRLEALEQHTDFQTAEHPPEKSPHPPYQDTDVHRDQSTRDVETDRYDHDAH